MLDRPLRLTAAPGTVTAEVRITFSLHLLTAAAGSTITGLHLRGQDGHATVKVEAPTCRFVECRIEASKVEGVWAVGPGRMDLEACRVSSALNIAVNVRGGLAVLRSCELSAPASVALAANSAQVSLTGAASSGWAGTP